MAKKEKEKLKNVDGSARRRNADGTLGPAIKRKPNKMNLVKPKRVEPQSTNKANPVSLVFPTDRFGLTTDIRSAVIAAVAKVGADKAKADLISDTIAVLLEHLEAVKETAQPRAVLKRRTLEVATESTETTDEDGKGTPEASTDETEVVTVKTKDGKKKRSKKAKK